MTSASGEMGLFKVNGRTQQCRNPLMRQLSLQAVQQLSNRSRMVILTTALLVPYADYGIDTIRRIRTGRIRIVYPARYRHRSEYEANIPHSTSSSVPNYPLFTFADFCRRPTCQSKHGERTRAIGGWAWLTSVTLEVIVRPSKMLAHTSAKCHLQNCH